MQELGFVVKMKLAVLIAILLILPLLSAETTFFDNEDDYFFSRDIPLYTNNPDLTGGVITTQEELTAYEEGKSLLSRALDNNEFIFLFSILLFSAYFVRKYYLTRKEQEEQEREIKSDFSSTSFPSKM